MGAASAYATVLQEIVKELETILNTNPKIFDFSSKEEGIIDVRDFQTTRVVSVARGCPFQKMNSGRVNIIDKRVIIREEYKTNCINRVRTEAEYPTV